MNQLKSLVWQQWVLSAFLKIRRWNFLEETVDLSLNVCEEFVLLEDKANHILSNISRTMSSKEREISFLSGHCWCGQTLLLVAVLGLVNGFVAISRQTGKRRQREASSQWRRQTWGTWLTRKGEESCAGWSRWRWRKLHWVIQLKVKSFELRYRGEEGLEGKSNCRITELQELQWISDKGQQTKAADWEVQSGHQQKFGFVTVLQVWSHATSMRFKALCASLDCSWIGLVGEPVLLGGHHSFP